MKMKTDEMIEVYKKIEEYLKFLEESILEYHDEE